MTIIKVVINCSNAKTGSNTNSVAKLNSTGSRQNCRMIDENIFPELYTVSKIADKRCENAYIIQLAAKKFFKVRNVAFVVGHLCICNRAEFSRSHTRFARLHERKLYKSSLTRLAHHLADGFLKIRLANICWSAFFHKFINIAWGVVHFVLRRN